MARFIVFVGIAMAIAFSGVVAARVPAQQPAPVQTELLAEVRLLRQAIESLAGTNARVQIVFGRLQLQEQRTTSASKRLEEARDALAKMVDEIANMNDHVKDVETMLSDNRRKPEELDQMRLEGVMVKRQIDRMEIERTRLAANEAEASSALNQEQGRWSDLNRQLEELERALTPKQ